MLPLATWIWWAVPPAICLAIAGLFALHRLCLRLEAQGLLYYRNRSGGGVGNALQPLDRLTRPSVEHVEEIEDQAKLVRKTDAGEGDETDLLQPES